MFSSCIQKDYDYGVSLIVYHSNKKKIRGWKRHKRKIEMWKKQVMKLDMEHINCYHRDYVKLWIHPFYGLYNIHPPAWYNRLLLDAIIEVYLCWYETMDNQKEEFYLKIWLYEPNFIKSQIVVAYRDNLHFYENVFDQTTENKSFPIDKYAGLQDKVALFDWKRYVQAEIYESDELQEDILNGFRSTEEVRQIIKDSYKIEKTDGNKYTYKRNVGDVWVGTFKTK